MTAESRPGSAAPILAAAVAGLAAVGALVLLLRPQPTVRGFELFPDMAVSPAPLSQRATTLLPGGTTDQSLPEGVVVRGRLPFLYGAGPEEAKRAGEERTNPFPADDAAALARGARVYSVYCVPCHGATGEGDGPVTRRGMLPPPSLHAVRATTMKDGEMFHVVTMGQGNMASYAAQTDEADRWCAILHVRALQKGGAR